MAKIAAQQVKDLRDDTGAGILAVKKALEEAEGNPTKAKEILKKKGLEKIAKRGDKETKEGQVYTYSHGGRIGGMVKVNCETDFVANSDEFVNLAKELAMQVASMNPKDVKELMGQAYIRDSKKKIQDLVDEVESRTRAFAIAIGDGL